MNFEDVLAQIDEAVLRYSGKHLSQPQRVVLRGSWENRTYERMAEENYSIGYLRQDVGPKLWDLLSDVFQEQEKVGKKNFRLAAIRWMQRQAMQDVARDELEQRDLPPAHGIGSDLNQARMESLSYSSERRSPEIDVETRSEFLAGNRRDSCHGVGSNATEGDAGAGDRLSGAISSDWGTALPADAVWGREADLEQIKGFIEGGGQRVILCGIGGIGKTALAWHLAHQLEPSFRIFWRSLQDHSASEVWYDLLRFLKLSDLLMSFSEVGDLGDLSDPSDAVSAVLQALGQQRCLVVLDHFEAVFQLGELAGQFRSDCFYYRQLLHQVTGRSLRSCLLLISREVPAAWTQARSHRSQIHNLQPLDCIYGQQFFVSQKSSEEALKPEQRRILEFCGGHPQALQTIAAMLHSMFGDDAGALMEALQDHYLPPVLRQVMVEQLERLSECERAVLDALAIAQQPLSLSQLRQDLTTLPTVAQLPDILDSLRRRSLIQSHGQAYRLFPPLACCLQEQFIRALVDEVCQGQLRRFRYHALIRANSRDDIRGRQQRCILQPIAQALKDTLRPESALQQQLQQVLTDLKTEYRAFAAYGAGNVVNLYRQLGWSLEGMDLSGLPLWQACLDGVSLARVNLAAAHLWQCKVSSCFGTQPIIALEPQGQFLAIGDRQGQLLMWNLNDNQQQILLVEEPGAGVTSLAIHPMGNLLASGHQNQRIYLWNVSTAERIHVLIPAAGAVTSLSFSHDGATLVSGSAEGWIQCWDVQSPNVAQLTVKAADGSPGEGVEISSAALLSPPLTSSAAAIRMLVWSPGDRQFVSLSDANEVVVWDGATGCCLQRRQPSETAPVKAVFCLEPEPSPEFSISSPDVAAVLMVCVEEGRLHVFDLAEGRLIKVAPEFTDMLGAIATATVFSSPRGDATGSELQAASGPHYLLAAANPDQTVRLWSLLNDESAQSFQNREGQVNCLALASKSPWLAMANDQSVSLWDLQTGTRCYTLTRDRCRVCSLAMSHDGALLAVGNDDDYTVKLWDVRTDSERHILRGHLNWVRTIAFSPNQRWCASGSEDNTIRLWDVDSGAFVQSFVGHREALQAIAFSPDSRRLASVDNAGSLKLWDMETGACLNSIFAHDQRIFEVQFNAAGSCLATASADHSIGLWDAETLDAVMPPLTGHEGRIHALAFNPAGDRLLSGSDDQTARLWNLSTGICEKIWADGASKIHAVACNSDGRAIVCASHRGTFGIWDLAHDQWIVSMPDETELILVKFGSAAEVLVAVDAADQVTVWLFNDGRYPRWFQINQLYKNMNISGVEGISDSQKKVLTRLGAVEQ